MASCSQKRFAVDANMNMPSSVQLPPHLQARLELRDRVRKEAAAAPRKPSPKKAPKSVVPPPPPLSDRDQAALALMNACLARGAPAGPDGYVCTDTTENSNDNVVVWRCTLRHKSRHADPLTWATANV